MKFKGAIFLTVLVSSVFREILCSIIASCEDDSTGYSFCLTSILDDTTKAHISVILDVNGSNSLVVSSTNCSQVIHISSSENYNTENVPADNYIFIESIGYYYAELLYYIFDGWNIEIDTLAIIYDSSGEDLAKLMVDNVKDETAVLLLKNGLNNEALTKARNCIVIGSNAFIHEIMQKAVSLNLLSMSNTWFLVSTDGEVHYNFIDGIVISLEDNYVDSINKTITRIVADYSEVTFNCNFDITNISKKIIDEIRQNVSTSEVTIKVQILQQSFNNSRGRFKNDSHILNFQSPDKRPTLRVSVVHDPPYVFKEEHGNDVIYRGYLIDILKDISTYVNFTYTLSECSDGIYGIQESDIWNGCIGDLVYHKTDIALAPLAVTLEREGVVDFFTPYLGTSGLQIVRERTITAGFLFLFVFSTDVWCSCIATILITSIILFIYQRFSCNNRNQTVSNVKRPTFGDTIWFVVSSICYEASDRFWKNDYSRILIAGFWFFSTVFMSCFTGNMAAFLTNIRLDDDSSTVLKELKNSDINFTVVEGSAELAYIKRIAGFEEYFLGLWKEKVYQSFSTNYTVWTYPLNYVFSNLMENLKRNPFPNSKMSALELILNNNFQLILDSTVASYLRNTNCNIEVVSEPIAMHHIGFAVTKGSKFKQIISERLLVLQQTQTFEDLKRKWWGDKSSCIVTVVNEGLTLYDLQGSFYVMAVGVFTAFTVLLVEIIYYKAKYKKTLAKSQRDSSVDLDNTSYSNKSANSKDGHETAEEDVITICSIVDNSEYESNKNDKKGSISRTQIDVSVLE